MVLGRPKSYEGYGSPTKEKEAPEQQYGGQSEVLSFPFQDQVPGEIIMKQLDTSTHLNDIEKRLSGQEKVWDDRKKKNTYVKIREPLLNDLGISRVMSMLRSVVDQNTILSSYEKEEAYTVIQEVVSTIIDLLYIERKGFNISKSDLPIIRSIIENGIKSTIFRSVDGITMDYLRGSHRTINTYVNPQQQSGGILKRLGGVFKW